MDYPVEGVVIDGLRTSAAWGGVTVPVISSGVVIHCKRGRPVCFAILFIALDMLRIQPYQDIH